MTGIARNHLSAGVAFVLCMLASPRYARASEVEPSSPKEHKISLTAGVVSYYTLGMLAEMALTPRVSTGLVVGTGSRSPVLVGIRSRYYVLGSFEHGLPLSWEVLSMFTREGAAMSSNVLVGYKKVFGFGLTLDLNLGLAAVPSRAGETEEIGTFSFLHNVGLGWSF